MSSVEARLGEFPARDCVNIKTILNTTTVNISTISYPNSSTAVSNQEMDKDGQTFNFTFCDTETIGVYVYDYFDAEGQVFVNDFLITPLGNSLDTGESFLYIWILIILALLSSLGVYLSTIIPYKNIEEETRDGKIIRAITLTKYMKLIVIWITSGIILMFLTVLTGVINNYVQFIEMQNLFTNTYIFLRIIGSGLSMGIMIMLFVNFYKDLLWNKTIREHGRAFVEKNARDSR